MKVIALFVAVLGTLAAAPSARTFDLGTEFAALFAAQVDRRLEMPVAEQERYAGLLADAMTSANVAETSPQFLLLVDRNPQVQAVMIFWRSPEGLLRFIGASPASTGRPGKYEHFLTPTGVFPHTLANFDFRAEGTKNQKGVLGYGRKGMRVYDFGWQLAARGWGRGGTSPMRLQMHSTDPDMLERRVGSQQSQGCIRIPASLNTFIDRYGLLDADYERAAADGRRVWVLRPDRQLTPWPGRYLVVIESDTATRPAWSPPPSQWKPARRLPAQDAARAGAPISQP